jgi:hypothetical protein
MMLQFVLVKHSSRVHITDGLEGASPGNMVHTPSIPGRYQWAFQTPLLSQHSVSAQGGLPCSLLLRVAALVVYFSDPFLTQHFKR